MELQVAQQYLGDVVGYEAQVSELEGQVETLEEALNMILTGVTE